MMSAVVDATCETRLIPPLSGRLNVVDPEEMFWRVTTIGLPVVGTNVSDTLPASGATGSVNAMASGLAVDADCDDAGDVSVGAGVELGHALMVNATSFPYPVPSMLVA